LGAVANVHITGGTSAYVLSTNGSGNLSWVAQTGGGGGASISNGNSTVNIPTANGNINLTAVGNTTMVVTGTGANITGTINVNGNANIGLGNVVWNGTNFRINTTTIQLGANAGLTSQGAYSVAIGTSAGIDTQGANSVAIGAFAGNSSQHARSVAIGANTARLNQGNSAVAIGDGTAYNTQGNRSVAIGAFAGQTGQGQYSIAIGSAAGFTTQGNYASNAIALGTRAGYYNQGGNAVAIGRYAGQYSQGANSVAIGSMAGNASQAANSIVINATGLALNNTTANSLRIAPIRNDTSNIANVLYYNTSTKEISYAPPTVSVGITGAAGGTITPTSGTATQYNITALGAAATFAVPSGTPVDSQKLTIRIKDDGTARGLTWTTSAGGYRIIGTTLPTTTVISKTLYVGCIYNTADSFWDVIAVAQQA
jgi:hypothetical protein